MKIAAINPNEIKKDINKHNQKIKLTTMVKVINPNGDILVIDRKKKDWPGLTFPGGHVEENESIEECAIREVLEETGLKLKSIKYINYIEWNDFGDGIRHVAMLFESSDYEGKIISSEEGCCFFINIKDMNNYLLSNDFDKILEKYQ